MYYKIKLCKNSIKCIMIRTLKLLDYMKQNKIKSHFLLYVQPKAKL